MEKAGALRGLRACLGQRLAGEEGLGLSTGGVGAQRAAQRQLAGARLLGLEVGVDQVGQSLGGEHRGFLEVTGGTGEHPAKSPCSPTAN